MLPTPRSLTYAEIVLSVALAWLVMFVFRALVG